MNNVHETLTDCLFIENSIEQEYVSFSELYQAYIDCRKHKRNTINSLKFEIDDTIKLYNLYIELNNKNYIIGNSIAFVVHYPTDREIFAADFRDRIIHHLIINRILALIENYEWINDTYSCRIDKGTKYGIDRIYDQIRIISNNYTIPTYILKLDLQACFVSVDKDLLYKKFINFLKDYIDPEELNYDLYLIKEIIYNKPQNNCIRKMPVAAWKPIAFHKSMFNIPDNINRGFAIGNLTSQIFVNFFLSELDKFIINNGFYFDEKQGLNNITGYGRYVDDFLIIAQDKQSLLNFMPKLKEFIEKSLHLHLSERKFYLQEIHKGCNFIGACLKPGRKYIMKRTVKTFKKKLKQWMLYAKYLDKNNIEMPFKDLEMFVSTINSYLGFLKYYATYNIKKKLLIESDALKYWKKYVYIHNEKIIDKLCIYKEIKEIEMYKNFDRVSQLLS